MVAYLQDLLEAATLADGPMAVPPSKISTGGVDPLGLRQINFRLMDMVLPGLNNVAARLRPFVLMTWAWRRVWQLVERDGRGGDTDERLRDFVDRIEAIYAWSQFVVLAEPGIPGGQALYPMIAAERYRFGGDQWLALRDTRRSSTGLISALNYGPGLRSMGWLLSAGPPGVFRHNPRLDEALDAFEAPIADELDQEAFSIIGDVTVERTDVERWGTLWSLERSTEAERLAGFDRFGGSEADKARRAGFGLIEVAYEMTSRDANSNRVRATMAARPEEWNASPVTAQVGAIWRKVQVRQVFRLALEGVLHWMVQTLDNGPVGSAGLASAFLDQAERSMTKEDADAWFQRLTSISNPVDHLEALTDALKGVSHRALEQVIAEALAFCLREAPDAPESFEASERLPLARARKEFEQWKRLSPEEFLVRIFEVWVLAQHAYWCVGRGLADARGRGKTLLRLKVVMDEGGWTLTPGTRQGNPPVATPDRLESALGLLAECGHLQAACSSPNTSG